MIPFAGTIQSAELQQEGTKSAAAAEIEKLRGQIESLEKAREEKKPDWLAQYELQQRLLADPAPSTPPVDPPQ